LGDHLRKARLDKGLLQKEVAELIGVTEESIVNWEWGHSYPLIKWMPSIINFIGYDPDRREDDSLASTLLNYRRQHGLKRKLLADKIGVDETTVLWWERGTEVKLKRSKEQLKAFFETEGIKGVEIPFYDAARRAREVHSRKRKEKRD